MKKEDKEVLKHLLKKELKSVREEGEEVSYPGLGFLKSIDAYEEKLKEILKNFNKVSSCKK